MFENSKTKIYYVFAFREFHYIFLEKKKYSKRPPYRSKGLFPVIRLFFYLTNNCFGF